MTGLFATQSDLVAAYARAPDVADYGAFMGVSSTILLVLRITTCFQLVDSFISFIFLSLNGVIFFPGRWIAVRHASLRHGDDYRVVCGQCYRLVRYPKVRRNFPREQRGRRARSNTARTAICSITIL
jgi:hypothetical protein